MRFGIDRLLGYGVYLSIHFRRQSRRSAGGGRYEATRQGTRAGPLLIFNYFVIVFRERSTIRSARIF